MVDDTQEIRDLDDPHNGPRTEVSKNTLNTEVPRALEVMTQDMGRRNLGKAILDIEAINLVLDHRFKSCCTGVCLNGGPALRAQVGTAMQGLCYQFVGNVGAVDKGDGGAAGAGEPGGEGAGGNEAAGGGGRRGEMPHRFPRLAGWRRSGAGAVSWLCSLMLELAQKKTCREVRRQNESLRIT